MIPLERAARALCLVDGVDPDSSLSGDSQNFLWMEYAEVKVKAVLEAIRYAPDDYFFANAGDALPPEFQSRGDKGIIACSIWQGMIDAALKEG